ncbi:MAG: hypothetical protein KJZ86_02585 [Caldilineaceae bacterium]|nr:hypothetical protein [Caldilineaceae bacterium]
MNRKHAILSPARPQPPSRSQTGKEAVRVDIYVTAHCIICEYAYEVADIIRSDFPEVKVRMLDLAHIDEEIPEAVFATPTYLLNGRLWSLGNPAPEEVQSRISLALQQKKSTNTHILAGDER